MVLKGTKRGALKKAALAAGSAAMLLSGCGTEKDPTQPGSTPAEAAFQSAVPGYDQVSAEMEDSDSSAPSTALAFADPASPAALSDLCHPHLFVRTHEVVARLNLHSSILLAAIQGLVARNPGSKTDTTHVWERVVAGVVQRLTLTRDSTGLTYTFTLELAVEPKSGDPAFVTVASGNATSNGGTPNEETGKMTFDFTALQSVVTSEQASGQLEVDFDVVKDTSKKLVYHFTQFLPRGGDPHGPRTGEYVFFRKPGVGGSLKYQDSLVLLCPSNPNAQVANLDTVAQWYVASDTSIHGRADARATGGQIADGNVWQGVTCHAGKVIADTSETYWMMKVEDGAGITVGGNSVQSSSAGPDSCDPAFIDGNAQVPSLVDNTKDFSFATSFNADGTLKDETPYLFPKIQ